MPTEFRKHQFETDSQATRRTRDVRVLRCTVCKKSVRVPMRTREPLDKLLEQAIRDDLECPGPVKKPTAADRPQFRRDVADMMQRLGVQVGVPEDAVILCTRAEDFDPSHNVLWELEANKSAVRPDVLCMACKSPMAMSNELYGRYVKADKKPKVCCPQCMVEIVKREEAGQA